MEREHVVACFCVENLISLATSDPSLLASRYSVKDLRTCRSSLDDNCVVRMFITFERVLRTYLKDRGLKIPFKAKDLIDRVSTRVGVPTGDSLAVHVVRDYRNAIVHSAIDRPPPVAIADARGSLCKFLSMLHR